jgi:hypothetical protein
MNIAVIGTGNVGTVLGTRWAQKGHRVVFGTRNPESEKVKSILASAGSNARAASVPEAVKDAAVVLLAVPWPEVEPIIRSAGTLKSKILVDCTNPLKPDLSGLAVGLTTSAGEQVAAMAKEAHVVKAFNTTGAKNMSDPAYGFQKATMFVCGDNAKAKSVVAELARELGFDTSDAGPLIAARYLEQLAMLWIHLAYVVGLGPDFVFKLLKR